mmetsp:Transcript_7362/g.17477  ORF Transcript_7362/g.17477 Transcript_7362/m.17477 type:complete len:287 (+) Transcript_7362:564-1424(+)
MGVLLPRHHLDRYHVRQARRGTLPEVVYHVGPNVVHQHPKHLANVRHGVCQRRAQGRCKCRVGPNGDRPGRRLVCTWCGDVFCRLPHGKPALGHCVCCVWCVQQDGRHHVQCALHASLLGVCALVLCLAGAACYKQAPKRGDASRCTATGLRRSMAPVVGVLLAIVVLRQLANHGVIGQGSAQIRDRPLERAAGDSQLRSGSYLPAHHLAPPARLEQVLSEPAGVVGQVDIVQDHVLESALEWWRSWTLGELRAAGPCASRSDGSAGPLLKRLARSAWMAQISFGR